LHEGDTLRPGEPLVFDDGWTIADVAIGGLVIYGLGSV
jgi:hypothetical protein